MVFGRMYREQEMAAIASAGGGMLTLYRAVFWLLIPLSLCAAGLSMYASPWAEAKSQQMMHNDEETADIRSIAPGRFSEYRSGELIFYSETLDLSGKMRNVFIQNKQGQRTGIANAEFGHIEDRPGGSYLVLEHGERIQGVPGQKDFSIEKYDEYAVLIERKTTSLILNKHSQDSEQLINSIDVTDIAELQDRLNSPIGVLLLGFLAIPLSRISPRGGVYGNMLVSFGIYFAYSNLQKINHSWIIAGKIPVALGYVWINAVLLLLGMSLLARFYGFQWLLSQLRNKKDA
jgi:lipopolysaccharide export system permease protein